MNFYSKTLFNIFLIIQFPTAKYQLFEMSADIDNIFHYRIDI